MTELVPRQVKLNVDGVEVSAPEGAPLIAALGAAKVAVPTLCADERLGVGGRCRVCVVEVQGRKELVASCCTPVAEGMVVKTASARVKTARRVIAELSEAEMPRDRQRGRLDGRDGLAEIAQLAGAGRPGLPSGERPRGADARHSALRIEFDKCVACGLCEAACRTVVTCDVLAVVGRGAAAVVETPFHAALDATNCIVCGVCAAVCPTGAIVEARGRFVPEVETQAARTVCPYCSVGCAADVVHSAGERVRVVGPDKGELCSRARFGLGEPLKGRLLSPLVRLPGHRRSLSGEKDPRAAFREASWDEALDRIAARLLDVAARRGPDAIAVLGSATLPNEDAYVLARWARGVIGTRHVEHIGRGRDAPLAEALHRAHGAAASTASLADVGAADVILVAGGDPWTSHPVAGMRLGSAARRGAKLVVIDPRGAPETGVAAMHLRPAAGGEPWVLWALIQVLVARGAAGPEGTKGLADLEESLHALDPLPLAELEGVPAPDVEAAAALLMAAQRPVVVTSDAAVPGVAPAVVNLATLLARGGGPKLLALWSEGNTQGALDAGLAPDWLPGHARAGDEVARARLEASWGARLDPRVGLDETALFATARRASLPDAGEHPGAVADGDGEIALGALVVVGGDPLEGAVDAMRRRLALERVGLVVAVDVTLGSFAQLADVVLPGTLPVEREGTITSADGTARWMEAAFPPPARARREWRIVAELAARMGQPLGLGDTRAVARALAADVPAYAETLGGGRVRHPFAAAPMLLPAPLPQALEKPRLPRPLSFDPVASRESARALALARRAPALAPLLPEPFIELHPADARFHGISDGDPVRVIFGHGELHARARLRRRTAPGTVVPAPTLVEAAIQAAAADPEGGPSAWSVRVEKA